MFIEKDINENLLKKGGILGRRGFILNYLHISAFFLVFSLPYTIWLMTKIGSFSDFGRNFFFSAPAFLQVWSIIGIVLDICLMYFAIGKRLSDIDGEYNETKTSLITLVLGCACLCGNFIPFGYTITGLCVIIVLGINIYFMVTPGKITGKLPKDDTKKFNWASFLGTWIWGLYNKSYIPLLMIPLFLTPWNFYFALICGIKGNEWAYKNKYRNVEKLKESQKKQTIFWIIFQVILIPVLYFGLVIAGVVYTLSNPELENSLNNYIESYMQSTFEDYRITESENIFYISENNWTKLSFNAKQNIFDTAANYAASERNKLPKDSPHYYSRIDELGRTKIYSAQNPDKLLAECLMPDTENTNFGEFMKKAMNAYRFYN